MTQWERRRAAGFGMGFTMIELVIVLAIMMLIVLISVPAIARMIARSQLEAAAQQGASLMRLARLEAIKRGAPAVVIFDTTARKWTAFIDLNDNAGNPGQDLLYNPQVGRPVGTTDMMIAELTLPRQAIPGGPTSGSASDALAVQGLTDHGAGPRAVFNADGSVPETGAFRLGDGQRNFLSITIDQAAAGTGRIQLLKWNESGTGAWLSRDMNAGQSQWVWY